MDNDATVFWLHSQLGLFVVQEHSKQSRKVASPLTQVHNTVIKNAVKIYTHQSSRSEQIDCVPGVIAQKILRMCNWIFECDTSPERDASVPMTGLTNNMTDDEYLLLAKCNFIPLAFGARFYIVNGIGQVSVAKHSCLSQTVIILKNGQVLISIFVQKLQIPIDGSFPSSNYSAVML